MRGIVFLIILCVLIPSTAAELPWSDDDQAAIAAYTASARHEGDFWVVERPLVVVRAAVDATFAAQAARYHEVLWQWLHHHLDLTPPLRPPQAEWRISADRAAYQADLGNASQSRGWFRWTHHDGAFTQFCLYSFIEFPRERDFANFYLPILVHEDVHLVLQAHAQGVTLPILLNEGVAAFFQSYDPLRDRDTLPPQRRSFYAAKAELPMASDELPALSDLLHADPWDIDAYGVQTQRRYVCAEMLIEHLLSDRDGKADLHSLLSRAIRGRDCSDRFQGSRGERLQTAWSAYLLEHQLERR